MIEITAELKDMVLQNGTGTVLFSALNSLNIAVADGYLAKLLNSSKSDPCLDTISVQLIRSVDAALSSAINERDLNDWAGEALRLICKENTSLTLEQQKSKLVELEAYGHLKSAFYLRSIVQLPERDGRGGKTPDLRIDDDIYIEAYCPDESGPERERVSDELASQPRDIKLAVSRPVTGSKPLAREFPTNQTIARILGAKRKNDQTVLDCKNILWLDVKHKLQLMACNTAPIQSVNHGENTYIECFGLWHAFYGKVNTSLFPQKRYCLKYDGRSKQDTYLQHGKEGLFRERLHMSAAIISCIDGNVLFLNPWCQSPLDKSEILSLLRIYHFRPEFSFFCKETLPEEVLAQEERIRLLLDPQRVAQLSADGEGK